MIAYRKANRGDIDEICRLVENAKDTLIRNGIFQWDDIYKKRLYVGLEGESIAVLYTLNRECDEEYKNGNWKYKDEPFMLCTGCASIRFSRTGGLQSPPCYI